MSIGLYEPNQRAYEAALFLIQEPGKAAVAYPTGTGTSKSFIAFNIVNNFENLASIDVTKRKCMEHFRSTEMTQNLRVQRGIRMHRRGHRRGAANVGNYSPSCGKRWMFPGQPFMLEGKACYGNHGHLNETEWRRAGGPSLILFDRSIMLC